METCVVESCDRPVHVKMRQLCKSHYRAFKIYGDPLVWKRPAKQQCEIEGCDRPRSSHGLCALHRARVKRYGTVDAPERPVVCSVVGCTKGVDALGMCDHHYRRTRRVGDPLVIGSCRQCGGDITAKSRRAYCSSECHQKWMYWERRDNHRDRWLSRYGLTVADFDGMLASQGGGCAICGTTTPKGRRSTFCVDHDHATGKVRGLLCKPCNSALGQFEDDPSRLKAAIAYLGRSSETVNVDS